MISSAVSLRSASSTAAWGVDRDTAPRTKARLRLQMTCDGSVGLVGMPAS